MSAEYWGLEIDRIKTEIARLREQVQFWHDKHDEEAIEHGRLRAALEEIAKGDNNYGQLSLREIARKALAKE